MLDFGLVRARDAPSLAMSRAGAVVGTPQYMAPEQITRPDQIDARADLYSLGCSLYYALTATPVFEGDSVVEICAAHLRDLPVPITVRNPDVPVDVARLVSVLLQKDPDERYANAHEVVVAIETLLEEYPWTERDSARVWDSAPSVHARSDPSKKGNFPDVTVDLDARNPPE